MFVSSTSAKHVPCSCQCRACLEGQQGRQALVGCECCEVALGDEAVHCGWDVGLNISLVDAKGLHAGNL